MIRKAVNLAVFLLIANALYQVAPAWIHYYQFKDALEELALFSRETSDTAVAERVLTLAEEHQVPLAREDVQIHREKNQLSIGAAYIQMLKVLPGYAYRWHVIIDATATHVQLPPGVGGR